MYLGEIRYINYDRDFFQLGLDRPYNGLIPFLHKRREYVDEREIRAVVSDLFEKPDTLRLTSQSVDLAVLIQEMVVSPEAGDWLFPLIKSDLERNSLGVVPRDVVYSREAGVAPSMPPCGRR